MTWEPTLPEINSDTEPWWDATRERRLLLQHCIACDHVQHYPRAVCTKCGSTDLDWLDSAGRGRLYSASRVERSPDEAKFSTPYHVALVALDEGPLIFTRFVGDSEPELDSPVTVDWHELSDGRRLPVFRAEE